MAARRSKAKVTTNHDEIRRWVEAKGACPAHVKGTERGSDPGVLRVDFPGYSGVATLEKLSWDDWFKWFDKKKLAFLYEPTTRFSKLVARETAAAKASTRATPRRATEAKRATAKRATAKRGAAKRGAAKRAPAKKTSTRTLAKRSATSSRGTAKRPTASKRGAMTKRDVTKRTSKRRGAKRAASSR